MSSSMCGDIHGSGPFIPFQVMTRHIAGNMKLRNFYFPIKCLEILIYRLPESKGGSDLETA
jgi:hypothetical protein